MGEQLPPTPSIKIEEVRENILLSRREVLFTLLHGGGATPDRWMVRQALAKLLRAPIDCVVVKSLLTRAGSHKTIGHAHVYESSEEALKIEPRHIYVRNLPPEERAKVLRAAKEARKAKAEKSGAGSRRGGKGG
ncbi:MAG: hypothetical protein N3H31_00430 [Candidatus Nezhaarchaeota archaeon]|nr:hypothetical protein [Candidatus Nezhaarchaeota archaeon]